MNKLAIITGANGGMGQELTKAIYQAGYHVIMACRSTNKAQIICDAIRKNTGPEIEVIPLDLASFSSIYAFSQTIQQRFSHVDLLLNNAGTLLHHAEITEDGLEKTVGVNYVGHYLLTKLLVDLMPPGSRIVNMVSLTVRFGKLNHNIFTPIDQKHFNRFTTYSDSKLALLYATMDFAEALKDKGIFVNCADPGIVNTNIIVQGNLIVDKLCDWFFRPIIYTPAKGASTMLYLALTPNLTVTGGTFAHKKQIKLSKKIIHNPYRKILHEKTEQLIEEITKKINPNR